MKIISVAVALLMVALPAAAKDPPPVDRAAAMARASQIMPPVEAGLSQPMADLYVKAVTGDAAGTWAYALGLLATRNNLDSMPPAQKEIYLDYRGRVDTARQAYQTKHPKADLSRKYMNDWVKPTPDEVEAVKMVNAIHDADYWFGRLAGQVDAAAVAQSRQCLDVIKTDIDSADLMQQLMAGLGGVVTDSTSGESVDLNALVNGGKAGGGTKDGETQAAEPKDDKTLDDEALCGGGAAYAHDYELLKAVYTPSLTITVTTK